MMNVLVKNEDKMERLEGEVTWENEQHEKEDYGKTEYMERGEGHRKGHGKT